jgi:hypothetical protein
MKQLGSKFVRMILGCGIVKLAHILPKNLQQLKNMSSPSTSPHGVSNVASVSMFARLEKL